MITIKKLGIDGDDISSCNCCKAKNYVSTIAKTNLFPVEDIYVVSIGSDGNGYSNSISLCEEHLMELKDSIEEFIE